MSDLHSRKVARVLVMLEYEPGDPDNGEVFDLTALAAELHPKTPYGARIHFSLSSHTDYSAANLRERGTPVPIYLNVSWSTQFSTACAHLTDAINCGLPDGERVQNLNRRITRLRKQADRLHQDALVAKLQEVAAIRAQHPIARVTAAPLDDAAQLPAKFSGDGG